MLLYPMGKNTRKINQKITKAIGNQGEPRRLLAIFQADIAMEAPKINQRAKPKIPISITNCPYPFSTEMPMDGQLPIARTHFRPRCRWTADAKYARHIEFPTTRYRSRNHRSSPGYRKLRRNS